MGSPSDPPGDAVLSPADRTRLDSDPDEEFYDRPRFVVHVETDFVERLTDLYREHLDPDDVVFDAMGSWTSHLPPEMEFQRVVGHGMNEAELERNDRLDDYFVQDFNEDQSLPIPDEAVDAVLCALSVQYLTHPTALVREFGRICRPGGVLIVAFSDRLFPTKAIRIWRQGSMPERADLVTSFVRAAGWFDEPIVIRDESTTDPFYAVVARRIDR